MMQWSSYAEKLKLTACYFNALIFFSCFSVKRLRTCRTCLATSSCPSLKPVYNLARTRPWRAAKSPSGSSPHSAPPNSHRMVLLTILHLGEIKMICLLDQQWQYSCCRYQWNWLFVCDLFTYTLQYRLVWERSKVLEGFGNIESSLISLTPFPF